MTTPKELALYHYTKVWCGNLSGNELTYNLSGKLSHSHLSLLSHCGLILA